MKPLPRLCQNVRSVNGDEWHPLSGGLWGGQPLKLMNLPLRCPILWAGSFTTLKEFMSQLVPILPQYLPYGQKCKKDLQMEPQISTDGH